MKIIFHEKFLEEYETDPAAKAGRFEPTYEKLKADKFYEFVEPIKPTKAQILRVHTEEHYDRISKLKSFEMSKIAVGGSLKAADLAFGGEPAFGFIRPPGHHASTDSCWGFCFFNNIAIALTDLIEKKKIKSAFLLDFDLHVGDGNIETLQKHKKIQILNPKGHNEALYLEEVRNVFESLEKDSVDIICASAGFDNAMGDWGGTLSTHAYEIIGKWMKDFSEDLCEGRRFALLEGGYNFNLLAENIDAFCKKFG